MCRSRRHMLTDVSHSQNVSRMAACSPRGGRLACVRCALSPGSAGQLLDPVERLDRHPAILQAAERGHTILGLVASNCGVAILPEPLMALPHSGVVFRPLTDPPGGELFLAWSRRRMCPVRDRFVQLLRSILDLQPQAPAATVAPKGIT